MITDRRIAWLVASVSAGVLAFEIGLLRILLVASWHHFAFLVISIALLGFGASGSVLCFARRRLLHHGERSILMLTALTALSMPLSVAVAQHVPVEGRFVPALLGRQVAAWSLYWLLLLVPFLVGGATIGLGLMMARQRVALVYGANLLGSAFGAVLITLCMYAVPPAWLPMIGGGLVLAGVLPSRRRGARRRLALVVITIIVAGAWTLIDPPRIRSDPYKFAAHVERLVAQGAAERLAIGFGPRGTIELYRGSAFHELPFLSGAAPVTALAPIVRDGHWSGALVSARAAADATVVDATLPAVAHDLRTTRGGRVLLLGEVGGANAWLAIRRGAETVEVVQPDAVLIDLLRGAVDDGGAVFDHDRVRVVDNDPRHFVEHAGSDYDLVQLVAIESLGAGAGGVGGLGEDHLATVQGLAAAIGVLDDDGVLSVSRGIQSPPRDALKLIATLIESLRQRGATDPVKHLVVVRDYLAVCAIVRPRPWTPDEIVDVRRVVAARQLTPSWFPGIRDDELNRPDELPGPPDAPGDWYHHAVTALSHPTSSLIDDWVFDVRPPTDDRPFFLDFCRLRSIGALRDVFGDLWLTRAELGFLFALGAAVLVGVAAILLTLLPVALLPSVRACSGRAATASYFGALGLGYMLLEMVLISRLTHLLGEPVTAAATTITAFLLFSGIGSMLVAGLGGRGGRSRLRVRFVIGAIILLAALLLLAVLPVVTRAVGAAPLPLRCAVGAALIAPLALAMGIPMPSGLKRIDAAAPALVPWAWGVNGFTSVLAAPLAMLMAMTWGYWVVALAGVVAYGAAAWVWARVTPSVP